MRGLSFDRWRSKINTKHLTQPHSTKGDKVTPGTIRGLNVGVPMLCVEHRKQPCCMSFLLIISHIDFKDYLCCNSLHVAKSQKCPAVCYTKTQKWLCRFKANRSIFQKSYKLKVLDFFFMKSD